MHTGYEDWKKHVVHVSCHVRRTLTSSRPGPRDLSVRDAASRTGFYGRFAIPSQATDARTSAVEALRTITHVEKHTSRNEDVIKRFLEDFAVGVRPGGACAADDVGD